MGVAAVYLPGSDIERLHRPKKESNLNEATPQICDAKAYVDRWVNSKVEDTNPYVSLLKVSDHRRSETSLLPSALLLYRAAHVQMNSETISDSFIVSAYPCDGYVDSLRCSAHRRKRNYDGRRFLARSD